VKKTKDSQVEQCVLRELQLQSNISSELCVFCCDGVATVSGTVNDHNEKRAAHRAAQRAPGVLRVVNRIRVSEHEDLTLSGAASRVVGGIFLPPLEESLSAEWVVRLSR